MTANKLPTLDDVAQRAKVSTATVSRVINTPDTVRLKTRLHVEAVILEMGYAPNFGAQTLAAKKTKIIGAVIPTMENAIFATGLQAFQETLAERGFTLLVASSSYRRDLEEQQIFNLVSRGVEGLLVIGDERDQRIYDFLQKRRLPYIVAWNYHENGDHHYVGFDNIVSMASLTERVLALGHRRIGVISGIIKENDRARDRLNSIKNTLKKHNILLDENHVLEAQYDLTLAGNALEELLRNAPDISVVMCGNDVLAVGAIGRAKALGIKVPEDLSFTGFDDIEISQIVEPALTTVHVPHRQMGRHAANLIINCVENGEALKSIKLESRVIERSSLVSVL